MSNSPIRKPDPTVLALLYVAVIAVPVLLVALFFFVGR